MDDLISRQAALDALAEWHDVALLVDADGKPLLWKGNPDAD